jgi:hypothetical protein
MAKKKQETGPGTGMIVTLVFFVLASLILGVTTYMGFDGQTELETKTKDAEAKMKTAQDQAADQTARLAVARAALNTADEADYGVVSGASGTAEAAALDEHNKIASKLGRAGALPGGLQWALANGKIPPAPRVTLPAIVGEWAKLYSAKDQEAKGLADALKKANTDRATADQRLQQETARFNAALAAETKRVTDAIADNEKRFADLKKIADQKGGDFKKFQDIWSEEKAGLLNTLEEERQTRKQREQKIAQLMANETSDFEYRFRNMQLEKLDSRKGVVAAKNGTFVTLRFDSRLTLVPGQSFVVIPPTGSLVEVIEREKALEKRHREFQSIKNRDPFTDNEMIKGTVEITSVTGPSTAEARITYQPNELRNPISKSDQVFNISLSSVSKEHVAFAGIIDLDGDGLPNNEEFVRILERNGLVLDAYLDIKTGELRNRGNGMNLRTKFLIIGTDAPQTGKIAEMQKRAKELGIQQIDASKFLALIGVKPPANPAPPAYNSRGVELGKDESATAPAPGAADPKADPKDPAAVPKKEGM